jgi:hypothetical protein
VEGLRKEDIPNEVFPRAGIETLEKPVAEANIIAERVTDLFIGFIFVECFDFFSEILIL